MTTGENRNDVNVIECSTFDDFVVEVRVSRWVADRLFRGQRDTRWALQSQWERWLSHITEPGGNINARFSGGRQTRHQFRRSWLRRFKDLASGLPSVDIDITALDDVALWALARHHGLVTPLLDWTRSPYVALFFACFDHLASHNPWLRNVGSLTEALDVSHAESVAVWELPLLDGLPEDGVFEVVTSHSQMSYRQKAQQGVFTMLTHDTATDLESYLRTRGLASYLTRYEVPGSEVTKALANLRLMNISWGTLFPDLEGAAVEANTSEALVNILDSQYLPSTGA